MIKPRTALKSCKISFPTTIVAAILIALAAFIMPASLPISTQVAFATSYTVSDAASCEMLPVSSPGTSWDDEFGFCIIKGTLTIRPSDTLTLNAGLAIESGGKLVNSGTITGSTIINHGTIENRKGGTITGDTIDNFGTFTNAGTINSNYNLLNEEGATLKNSGVINAAGVFNNYSSFVNSGKLVLTLNAAFVNVQSGIVDNTGTISISEGQLYNYGTFNNHERGVIKNVGTIYNYAGTIENQGLIDNQGTIYNSATINNEGNIKNDIGYIQNDCGGVINNTGHIKGNPPVDNCAES
jgi:hypothetical protein